jgi:sugar phosphate isomerase/epimerase
VLGHPRVSVNSICSIHQSLPADVAMWQDLGIDHVGLSFPKIDAVGWDAATQLIADARLRVSTVVGPTFAALDADPSVESRAVEQAMAAETLEFAASIGAGSVYVCSGGASSLTWDEAADAFRDLIAPAAALANELGIPLLLESTNPLRSDVSFVYRLRDAVDLARAAGIRVLLVRARSG